METFKNDNVTPMSEFSAIEMENAVHSARYILEDVSMEKMSKLSGLPLGVINAAFRNIFEGGVEMPRISKPKRVKENA